jgi:hypothetical protein
MNLKPLILIVLAPFLQGCWNADNAREIHFGDVSIGRQMIDLKQALEEGAITVDEHAQLKQALMSFDMSCDSEDSDDES